MEKLYWTNHSNAQWEMAANSEDIDRYNCGSRNTWSQMNLMPVLKCQQPKSDWRKHSFQSLSADKGFGHP